MLIVLLKKNNYNTKVADIDTKLSRLDGKITKNEFSRKELNKIEFLLENLIVKLVLKLI